MAEKADRLRAFDDAVEFFERDWSPSDPGQPAIPVVPSGMWLELARRDLRQGEGI